ALRWRTLLRRLYGEIAQIDRRTRSRDRRHRLHGACDRERSGGPGDEDSARDHLCERHRPDTSTVLSELSSDGPDGADVAPHLPGSPALGQIDQATRDGAPDAA